MLRRQINFLRFRTHFVFALSKNLTLLQLLRGSPTGFHRPETACHKKKKKKRFKNQINCNEKQQITYSEKYIIVLILSGDLSLTVNVIFWRFFIFFNILNVFVRWKNGKISKPKIVHWYLDFRKESYTTLKSVTSSFKIFFSKLWAT